MKYNLDKLDDLYRLKDDILSPFDNLPEDDLDMIFKELCRSYNIKWNILYVGLPYLYLQFDFSESTLFSKDDNFVFSSLHDSSSEGYKMLIMLMRKVILLLAHHIIKRKELGVELRRKLEWKK